MASSSESFTESSDSEVEVGLIDKKKEFQCKIKRKPNLSENFLSLKLNSLYI